MGDIIIKRLSQNRFCNSLTVRQNPDHGFLGDLIESGIGKIAKIVRIPEIVAMNRIAAKDMLDRKDIKGATNLYHSQGTIIGEGAMQIYGNDYMRSVLTYDSPKTNNADANWTEVGGTLTLSYTNQIDPSQKFVAVGPAVGERDWKLSTESLGLGWNDKNYQHDPLDSVRYLTSPSNIIDDAAKLMGKNNFNSPIYIPNPIDFAKGIWHLKDIEHHDVTNPIYLQHIDPVQKQDLQN